MKHNQLVDLLTKAGCYVIKHGKKHDIWYSPKTQKQIAVPRHGSKEVARPLETEILKKMLGR
ncbi:MAG: type II toxin-antitoxin system HicA family toxin [Prevotella sp.]|nr:type II toxin-antitoxin system HicA family toxin [Prevotella sp.]